MIPCEWSDCGETFEDPSLVYAHLTSVHVGKRPAKTHDGLRCRWGRSCAAVFTKRDHLTSHLRIHVPLKPFLCNICSRAFKRPQDLKKHDKLHHSGTAETAESVKAQRRASVRRQRRADDDRRGDSFLGVSQTLNLSACSLLG
ncbi:hypothetical protein BC830DRAFT_1058447 [Chytriomyces sp. MP71]|nr:hypothetical protein BC830DRAFT_1058447 [Chytriomyces sp. MP71]